MLVEQMSYLQREYINYFRHLTLINSFSLDIMTNLWVVTYVSDSNIGMKIL